MSKYTITLQYKNGFNVFKSDNLDECNSFLASIPRDRKFENLELSYALESNKNTYKVVDRDTNKTLKVIPKETGTAMMFGLHGILMGNNRL